MSSPHTPLYCIIIIINKKRDQQRTFPAQMFLFFLSIQSQHPAFLRKRTALSLDRAEVLCQGQEWQQTHVCSPVKRHSHRNVGVKEDLERPMLARLRGQAF